MIGGNEDIVQIRQIGECVVGNRAQRVRAEVDVVEALEANEQVFGNGNERIGIHDKISKAREAIEHARGQSRDEVVLKVDGRQPTLTRVDARLDAVERGVGMIGVCEACRDSAR